MAVSDLQAWADHTDEIRLPEIEDDISANALAISDNATLITQRAQELTDRLDANSARITAARNIADAAEADATDAHSSVTTLDITLRQYVDSRVQWLHDDYAAGLSQIQATVETNVTTTIQDDLDAVLPTLEQERADAVAEVNAVRVQTEQTVADSQAAIDELYGTVLPGYDVQLTGLQDDLGLVTGDLQNFLLGHSGETLLESLDEVRAENEARLAPMDMPAIREPRSMWGRDLDLAGDLWKNTLGLYGTFVTDDPSYGEAFQFGDAADTNVGPAYPLPFEAGRIYRITAKVRCVDDGTLTATGAGVMMGATVNQGTTQLSAQQKAAGQGVVAVADGDVTLNLYVSSDQTALEEYGLDASQFLVLGSAASGTWIYPFVAQNPGATQDGILRLGAFEVVDVSDVADGMKVIRSELTAEIGNVQGQITNIQALDVDAFDGTALAVFLSEMQVDAGGNSATIASLDSAVATLDDGVVAIQNDLVAVSSAAKKGLSVLDSQFLYDATDWDVYVTAPTVTGNERHTLGWTWAWDIGTEEAGTGLDSNHGNWVGATNPDAFAIDVEFELVSGTLEGAGISMAWRDATNPPLREEISLASGLNGDLILGQPTIASFVIQKPGELIDAFDRNVFYLFANYAAVGTPSTKHLKIHRIEIRPATTSEALVQEQKTAIASLKGHLSATYSLALIAGEESAGLQFVVSDDPDNPVSTLKASARNILLEGSVSMSHLQIIADSSNQIQDPYFEDPFFWESSDVQVVTAAQAAWNTPNVLQMDGAGGDYLIRNSRPFPVGPGEQFSAGFQASVPNADGNALCQIQFSSDSSFTAGSTISYASMGGPVSTIAVSTVSASGITTPAGAKYARVQYVKQNNGTTRCFLGNAYVRRMADASLIVDGALTVQGMAAFGDAVASYNYLEDGAGVPLAGWELDAENGAIKGVSIIGRNILQNGSVSDEEDVTLPGPAMFDGTITVLETPGLPQTSTYVWTVAVTFEFRANLDPTLNYAQPALQGQYYSGGAWSDWETIETQASSNNTNYWRGRFGGVYMQSATHVRFRLAELGERAEHKNVTLTAKAVLK